MLDDTTPPASSRAGPVLQGASSGTSDQAAWLAVVAATGAGVLAVHAHDADASGKFPAHCLAALRDAGLMEVGALGESAVQRLDLAVRIVAEAGRHCATTAFGLGMHLAARLWGGCGAHAMAGDGRLCTLALPDLPGCLPLPVVHGVLARRVAGGWLLHGRRPLVPMAGVAQCHVVPCTPDQPGATAGDALLLAVDVHAPGVRVEGAWDAMGLRGLDLRERVLEDVFVPEADVLQPEGACARSAGQWPHLQLLEIGRAHV